MRIGQLTVVGVGLIGGSLARALRRAHAVERVVGAGRSESHLARAQALGVVDDYSTDLATAVRGADVVLVCVPLGAMRAVFEAIKPALGADTIVTDVGSAKGSVVADAEAAFGAGFEHFVPGHPIAGTERSGVEASFAELFERRRVILTPLERTRAEATAAVRAMWEAAGAEVVEMGVEHHDQVLAATSHLPHVLAYGLVDTLARWDSTHEVFGYAAGGFRDFTRIASSDPVMWRDIALANRAAIVDALERYVADIQGLLEAVRAGDAERLESVFRNAKSVRDRFVDTFEK